MTTSPADDQEEDIFHMEEVKEAVQGIMFNTNLREMSCGASPTDPLMRSSMNARMEGTGLQCKIRRCANPTGSPVDVLTSLCIALYQSGHDALVASPFPYPMRNGALAAAANESMEALYGTTYACSFQPYIVIMQRPVPPSSVSAVAQQAGLTTNRRGSDMATLLHPDGAGVGGGVAGGRNAPSSATLFSFNSVGNSSMASSDCASGGSSGGSSAASTSVNSDDEGSEDFWVVEINLRDLFRVAPASEEYNALLSRVPEMWVGPRSSLLKLAERMCEQIEANYLFQSQHDRDVPPWRRLDAFLRRWDLSACSVDRPALPPSPPTSPETPPRQSLPSKLPLTAFYLQQLLVAARQDLMPFGFGDRDRSSSSSGGSTNGGSNNGTFPAYSEMLSAPAFPVFPVPNSTQERSATTSGNLAWADGEDGRFARHTSVLPAHTTMTGCSCTRCYSQSFCF